MELCVTISTGDGGAGAGRDFGGLTEGLSDTEAVITGRTLISLVLITMDSEVDLWEEGNLG